MCMMYVLFLHSGISSTRRNRWDETPKTERGLFSPAHDEKIDSFSFFNDKLMLFFNTGETPGHSTPGHATPGWAETPRTDRTGAETPGATPTPGSKRRSRWDETPASQMGGTTPMIGTSGVTPAGAAAMQMQTPTPGQMAMTPEQMQAYRWEREIDERNRYLSDEELDSLFPKEGYKVLFIFLFSH